MPDGLCWYEPCVDAQDALTRGSALPEQLTGACPLALYGAALAGNCLVLGRYQHEQQVLGEGGTDAPGPQAWIRRASGGAAVWAGAGVVYVALALRERSVLMQCPPGRLLNRNVRGVLHGLRHVGLPLNYFGRDFLSCGAEPVIYVGWDAREPGSVLLEFFIAHSSAWFVPDPQLSYPPRSQPALRGRVPTTITHVRPGLAPLALFQAIADGHARSFGVSWSAHPGATHERASASEPDPTLTVKADNRLVWSAPHEEAIGFLSAGVCLDDRGKFAAVRVVGDFFAHRACVATLEARLLGTNPSIQGVGEAVDAAFTRSGYDVEGIRNLGAVRDVILEASARYAEAQPVLANSIERTTPGD